MGNQRDAGLSCVCVGPAARNWWRWVVRPIAAMLVVLGCIALFPPDVLGHAALESTSPSANEVLPEQPDQVVITFNEPVNPVERQFRLFDSQQNITQLEPTASGNSIYADLPDDLANGSYVFAWRVISADGHPIAGAVPFAIGEKSSSEIVVTSVEADPWIDRLLGLMNAVTYVCFLTVVGLLGFRQFLERRPRPRTLPTVLVADQGLIAMALAIPLTVARQQAEDLSYLFDVDAWAAEVRTDTWVALGLAVFGTVVLLLGAGFSARTLRSIAMMAGGVVLLGSLSVVGHTRIVDPRALIITSNVTHVVAGAVWLGGLIGLTLAFRRATFGADGLAGLVARFSGVAAIALAAVLVSGGISAVLIVQSWSALLDTSYGRLLLVKIGLVLIVCGLAGWNRFRLVPLVTGIDENREARERLLRIVRIEASILIVVAILTGFLVNLSPRVAAVEETHTHTHTTHPSIALSIPTGEATVQGELTHIDERRYTLKLQVLDESGAVIAPYEVPRMTLTLESLDIGPIPVNLVGNPDGTLFSASVDFPFSGEWTVDISVRFSTFESASGFTTIQVPPP